MKKLKIGIDIDNVISDTFTAYKKKFESDFGTDISVESLYQIFYFDKHFNFDKKKIDKFINNTLHTPKFQSILPPFLDAVKTVKKLHKNDHKIHFISGRPHLTYEVTREWLINHGFFIETSTLSLCNYESGETDGSMKNKTIRKYQVDLMIEDSLDIARVLNTKVLLIDRLWNKGRPPKHIQRVFSWEEIDQIIQRMTDGQSVF